MSASHAGLTLLRSLRRQGLVFAIEGDGLRVTPRELLSADLRATVAENKRELLDGLALEAEAIEVLGAMRPYLRGAFRSVPDDALLRMVQFTLLAGYESAIAGVRRAEGARR